jgi:hypothetical protein
VLEQFKHEEEERRRSKSVSGRVIHALSQTVSRRLSKLPGPEKEKDPMPLEEEAHSSATKSNAGGNGEAGSDLEQACLTHEETKTLGTRRHASDAIYI